MRPSRNKPQNATRPTPRRNSESVNNNRARGLLRTAVSGQLFGRPGRSASSAAAPEYNPHHHARYMRDLDLDLEDYLVLEAIRMSLAEYEQSQQRRTEEERNRNTTENGTDQQQPEAAATAAAAGVSASSSPCAATTITETRPADNSDNPMSSESDPENAEPKTCQNREIVSNPSPNTLNWLPLLFATSSFPHSSPCTSLYPLYLSLSVCITWFSFLCIKAVWHVIMYRLVKYVCYESRLIILPSLQLSVRCQSYRSEFSYSQ